MPTTEVRCEFCYPDDPRARGCCRVCGQVIHDYLWELARDRDVGQALRAGLSEDRPLDRQDAWLALAGALGRGGEG
jgi:hypothetical protein